MLLPLGVEQVLDLVGDVGQVNQLSLDVGGSGEPFRVDCSQPKTVKLIRHPNVGCIREVGASHVGVVPLDTGVQHVVVDKPLLIGRNVGREVRVGCRVQDQADGGGQPFSFFIPSVPTDVKNGGRFIREGASTPVP